MKKQKEPNEGGHLQSEDETERETANDDEGGGKAGRPTKFDAEVASRILSALSLGAWKKTACAWAGIDYTTFKRWMRRGRDEPDTYPELADFARKVEQAENGCEIRAGRKAFEGALEDPKLALEWLKVRHRRRWSPKQEVRVSGDAKNPLHVKHEGQLDLAKLEDDELTQLETLVSKAAPVAASNPNGEGET